VKIRTAAAELTTEKSRTLRNPSHATLYLICALLIGCNQAQQFEATPDVLAERHIEIREGVLAESWKWSMTIYPPQRIVFGSARVSDASVNMMSFVDVEQARSVFSTFIEWDRIARENKVQAFRKSIRDGYGFYFSPSGSSSLDYFSPVLKTTDTFTLEDVEKCTELLKHYPAAQAELDSKLQKARTEVALFNKRKK
jgi:hypothetical protein